MGIHEKLFNGWMSFVKSRVSSLVAPQYLEDALQEGYIGLWRAIISYESSMNIQFNTYASVCIKNAVLNLMAKEKNQTDSMAYFSDMSDVINDRNITAEDFLVSRDTITDIVKCCGDMTEREQDILFSRLLSSDPDSLQILADRWNVVPSSIMREENKLKIRVKEGYENWQPD